MKDKALTLNEMTDNFLETGDPERAPFEWLEEFRPVLVSRGVPTDFEVEQMLKKLGADK